MIVHQNQKVMSRLRHHLVMMKKMINNKRKKICSKIINREKEKEEVLFLFLLLTCFKRLLKMKVVNSIMRKMNKILIKIKIE